MEPQLGGGTAGQPVLSVRSPSWLPAAVGLHQVGACGMSVSPRVTERTQLAV